MKSVITGCDFSVPPEQRDQANTASAAINLNPVYLFHLGAGGDERLDIRPILAKDYRPRNPARAGFAPRLSSEYDSFFFRHP